MRMLVHKAIIERIKKELRKEVSGLKSMHTDEAIARGFGYRTYKALLAHLARESDVRATVYVAQFSEFLFARDYGATAAIAGAAFHALALKFCEDA